LRKVFFGLCWLCWCMSLDSDVSAIRLRLLKRLTPQEVESLWARDTLSLKHADKLRENVLGLLHVPLGVVDGLRLNGRVFMVPLAIEERGVVEMVKRGVAFVSGGFMAESSEQIMIGQIQVVGSGDIEGGIGRILAERDNLLIEANTLSTTRKAVDLKARILDTAVGPMIIVEVYVDVKDSMGANVVNSMCERIRPAIEELTGGRVNMSILTNLTTGRMVRVHAHVPCEYIGSDVVEKIVKASAFADVDPYRAVTHNKGIMNGVSAVLLATSNDTRAVEAGAHAYASLSGTYRPLSTWRRGADDGLVGRLEMPLSVGTVGGAVNSHPVARINLKLLGVDGAAGLAQVAASVGLASNLGAIYTLVTEGVKSIQ
jgi:hydroxymethylglutaryl-CoA reductase